MAKMNATTISAASPAASSPSLSGLEEPKAQAISAGAAQPASTEPIDTDYPLTPVPFSARKSGASIAVVLLGFTIFAPTLMAGASVGAAFRFSDFLLLLLIGSAVLGTYVAAIGFLGSRTGLTTVVMSRFSFGNKGSKFVSLLLGGTQVGWYGVAVGTVGEMTALALGWESWWAPAAVMIVISTLMALTALYGYEGMYWVSLISTPLILMLAVWITWLGFNEVGGWSGMFTLQPASSMTWSVAVTTIVGTFSSAGTQAANWTRFARSGKSAVTGCIIGFILGNGAMVFFGAVAALAFGEADFVKLLVGMGLGAVAIFFLVGNFWKSNADGAYAFGVAGAEMFDYPSKAPFIVGGATLGTILALTGVQGHIVGYLALLGIAIPPLGGVIIGDWIARWRKGQPAVSQVGVGVRWQGFVPYILGTLLAWYTNNAGIGIAPLNGIIAAMALAWFATKLFPDATDRAVASGEAQIVAPYAR